MWGGFFLYIFYKFYIFYIFYKKLTNNKAFSRRAEGSSDSSSYSADFDDVGA